MKGWSRVNHGKHVQKVIFTRPTVLDNDRTQGGNNYLEKSIFMGQWSAFGTNATNHFRWNSQPGLWKCRKAEVLLSLEGFDNKWIGMWSEKTLCKLHQLKSRVDYLFQGNYRTPEHESDSQITELCHNCFRLSFIKTWWFFILIIFIASIIVFYCYQWRISAFRNKGRSLTEKSKRTPTGTWRKIDVLSEPEWFVDNKRNN